MITLSLLLIAALSMMPLRAKRIHFVPGAIPHTRLAPAIRTGQMAYTPANLPDIRMAADALSGDDDPEYQPSPFQGWVVPTQGFFEASLTPISLEAELSRWVEANKISISDRQDIVIDEQTFPPVELHGIDIQKLLQQWAGAYVDPFSENVGMVVSTNIAPKPKNDDLPAPAPVTKILQDDKARVLHSMLDVLADLPSKSEEVGEITKERLPLMVGLIAKDLAVRFLESGSSAADESMLALGTVEKATIQDDRQGSLRIKVEERYGRGRARGFWGRGKKTFDVFAIKGLTCAPGLDERSTRVLLSKIEKLAEVEQKIVVISHPAYISRDGQDLTDYYLRLGFEKLEMVGRPPELIYMGSSPSAVDMWVESQQVMVQISLLASV